MRRLLAIGACAVWLALPQRPATAQDATGAQEFGPALVIEAVEVEGNSTTAERLILRALEIGPGDRLMASDRRLAEAKYNVLALGFFRHVSLSMRKGSARGRVVVTVHVVERGTVILNRLYFGNSQITPWWAGMDLTERNFFGTGLSVGGAFVAAGQGDAADARPQRAFELRIGDPSILGTELGAHGGVHFARGSEPFRVSGDPSDGSAEHYQAFDYSRVAGTAGASYGLTPLSSLVVDGRVEVVEAQLPTMPTRTLPDGRTTDVELHLEDGRSRIVTLSAGYDRDTRTDPVLPDGGNRLLLRGEVGSSAIGSSYDFGSLLALYQHWWPVRSVHHIVSLHLSGGVVVGDAPRFDLIHVGDLNRMVSPRALGLVVAATPSHDLLGTASDDVTYGVLGGAAEVQYSYRLFRSNNLVYGGDLFVGVGVWGLRSKGDLLDGGETLHLSIPIDLMLDAGLRLDTEIGIFELGVANALGRLPL